MLMVAGRDVKLGEEITQHNNRNLCDTGAENVRFTNKIKDFILYTDYLADFTYF